MSEKESNIIEELKTTYMKVLDQAASLTNKTIESTKKAGTAAFDAQQQAFESMIANPNFAPLRTLASNSAGYIDLYAKRVSEGFELANKTADVFAEVGLTWQKVALEAQNNAFNAYMNYFAPIRAQVSPGKGKEAK